MVDGVNIVFLHYPVNENSFRWVAQNPAQIM
jgi:hypothetical protein